PPRSQARPPGPPRAHALRRRRARLRRPRTRRRRRLVVTEALGRMADRRRDLSAPAARAVRARPTRQPAQSGRTDSQPADRPLSLARRPPWGALARPRLEQDFRDRA